MTDSRAMLYATREMTALFSAESFVRHMLQFEQALARAEVRAALIPSSAADDIAAACQAMPIDAGALFEQAALAGTPVIPLLARLRAVLGEEGRNALHLGATSQDAIDTALMLQMQAGLGLLEIDLLRVCAGCAALAEGRRSTLMAGRTLLQQALPITFGLKAARWLALCCRQVEALRAVRSSALALQFGGAAGTLAALGNSGGQVAAILADELALPLPDLPWHAERDRVARIACALGVLAGAMLKIAGDVVLLAQSEVGELAEQAAPGKGGSSSMPHKHNPVDAIFAITSARVALGYVPILLNSMAQEHERAAGNWQTEWLAIPALFCATSGAVERVARLVDGLQVDAERMRANLDAAGGLALAEALMTALVPAVGRAEAQRLVQAASRRATSGASLLGVALADDAIRAYLDEAAIRQALDPAAYLGQANAFVDRALADYRALQEHPQ